MQSDWNILIPTWWYAPVVLIAILVLVSQDKLTRWFRISAWCFALLAAPMLVLLAHRNKPQELGLPDGLTRLALFSIPVLVLLGVGFAVAGCVGKVRKRRAPPNSGDEP
jgi:hypothetical protein